jgi:hypothetical protein
MIRGFNVSNLLGIKRRMIDMSKTIIFTPCKMFENVHFFAFAVKAGKNCYYDPKKIFVKDINMGIKKRRILC